MTGPVGPEVLAAAVERVPVEEHDGRSGASLERLRLGDGTRLVVKRTCRRTDLTMRLSGDDTGRELDLWAGGVLEELPSGVGHAVVGAWYDGDDAVLVMRDLADAVVTWDTPIGRADCRRIFAAAASLHDRFAGRKVDGLCSLDRRLSLFAPRTLRTVAPGEHPLVDVALVGWERFADLVPADVSAAVSALHGDPGPLLGALTARGTTLTHGDLWLVNTAFEDGQVTLLDWSLATAAPGAFDFATFLMGASAVAVARDNLLDDIRQAQGGGYDDTALRLALLAALVDLGWNKALDATSDDDAVRRRETAELDWWVAQARHALDLGAF